MPGCRRGCLENFTLRFEQLAVDAWAAINDLLFFKFTRSISMNESYKNRADKPDALLIELTCLRGECTMVACWIFITIRLTISTGLVQARWAVVARVIVVRYGVVRYGPALACFCNENLRSIFRALRMSKTA